MCGCNCTQRGNYLGGEPIRNNEVEVRMRKVKNGKAEGKDKVAGEMVGMGKFCVCLILCECVCESCNLMQLLFFFLS